MEDRTVNLGEVTLTQAVRIAKLAHGTAVAYMRMLAGNAVRRWDALNEAEQRAVCRIVARVATGGLRWVPGGSGKLPINLSLNWGLQDKSSAFIPDEIIQKVEGLLVQTIQAVLNMEAEQETGIESLLGSDPVTSVVSEAGAKWRSMTQNEKNDHGRIAREMYPEDIRLMNAAPEGEIVRLSSGAVGYTWKGCQWYYPSMPRAEASQIATALRPSAVDEGDKTVT